jgi:circadian clock protein KaiB
VTVPKLAFELFVTGRTRQSQRAIQNLRGYFAEAPDVEYELTIIDVVEQPERAEERHILATPTLIRTSPLPPLRIIGDLSERDVVKQALGLLGASLSTATQTQVSEDHDHE